MTIAEMMDTIGPAIEANNRRYLLQRLGNFGTKMLTSAKVMEIKPGEVILGTFGKQWSVPCETVVLAVGATPNRTIFKALREAFPNFYIIGDALNARTAKEAMYEGARIGRQV